MYSESDRRALVNRLNAVKSTGPKTAAGKAASSRNALKHGMRAEAVVLPNEDAAAFEELRREFIKTYESADEVEDSILDLAASSLWRIKRCIGAETANLSKRVRDAGDAYDLEQFEKAENLGRRLLRDPVCRIQASGFDPIPLTEIEERNDECPILLADQLRGFSAGVDWLLVRLSRFHQIPVEETLLHHPEKHELCRLLGRRPEEMLNESDTIKQTVVSLRDVIEAEIARLTELRRTKLDPLDRLNREQVQTRASFDSSDKAVLTLRYEAQHQRVFSRALNDLQKKRKEEGRPSKHPEWVETELSYKPIRHAEPGEIVTTPEPVKPAGQVEIASTPELDEGPIVAAETRRVAPPNEPIEKPTPCLPAPFGMPKYDRMPKGLPPSMRR